MIKSNLLSSSNPSLARARPPSSLVVVPSCGRPDPATNGQRDHFLFGGQSFHYKVNHCWFRWSAAHSDCAPTGEICRNGVDYRTRALGFAAANGADV